MARGAGWAGRGRRRRSFAGRSVGALLLTSLVLAACGASSAPEGPPASSGTNATASIDPVTRRCGTEFDGAAGIPTTTFSLRTTDGVLLYGAAIGSGARGVVLANDVPHPFCQDVPPALVLARRGYRVVAFDYRGHGDSAPAPASAAGRLDLDVAAAAQKVRELGATSVALLGSYAGAAACIVASIRMMPAVDAVVGFSPAAYRGQYVSGPFGPEGALTDAPKLRMPVLYATAQDDRFISAPEVRALLRATGSHRKDMVEVARGPGGWYLLQYNSSVRRAVLRFLASNL